MITTQEKIDTINKELKKQFALREKLNKEFADEYIVGRAFGYPEAEYFVYAIECDGKTVRSVVVQVYSQWMCIEDLPLKSNVFQRPITVQEFTGQVEKMKQYFIGLTKKGE